MQVQRVAWAALKLHDANPSAAGAQHAQSQRFLSADWKGLSGGNMPDPFDPPLRKLVVDLSIGDSTLSEYLSDPNPSTEIKSFVRWISAFRHVTYFRLKCGWCRLWKVNVNMFFFVLILLSSS